MFENAEGKDLHGDAWREAIKRVEDIDEDRANELMIFTNQHTKQEIEDYIKQHADELSPEEIFFLDVTIGIRQEAPWKDESAKRMGEHARELEERHKDGK